MSVFVVIGRTNPNSIREAVVRQYGANHYQFSESSWFVQDNGTTKDVADKLGIVNGELGAQGVVLRFDAYSGFAPADGWKWLGSQPGTIPNG
jgi:hypothetical protein